MRKEDFEYLERTLRELSLFVAQLKAQEPWKIEEQQKARFRSLFYLVGGPNDPNRSPELAPMRQNVVSQPNKIYVEEKGVSQSEEKEIDEMFLNVPGVSINSKPRKDGRFQGYVIKNNERIYVYGRTKSDVAVKINLILKGNVKHKRKENNVINGIPQTIDNFTKYFFEKFRKKKVAEKTYKNDLSRYKNHIAPFFKNKLLKKISPGECQDLLDRINGAKKYKTAEEVYSILSIIFKGAILHGVITKNPLAIVYHEKHERKHGSALTAEEITFFKERIKGTSLEGVFTLMLYTGLRPNEVKTVRFVGEFVIAVNSKRKTKRVEYKRIPILPALKPFVREDFNFSSPDYLRREFKAILPNHVLYDLRTTFYSKCKECNVAEPALNHYVGHSSGVLADTYTNLSDEYLLLESKKIRF